MSTPFHAGELAVQERAGVRERVAELGPRLVRATMPEQHRELFARLPMLLVGSVDAHGQPWASALFGAPGFVLTPDARRLRVNALPVPSDPLHEHLAARAPLGLLGVEPATRRRNRANGRVVEYDSSGFVLAIEQSFGNCPQYIEARTPLRGVWLPNPAPASRASGRVLAAAARALVESSDTFFIASAAAGAVDVSHRGGAAGFVRLDSSAAGDVLTLPDYRGNNLFNTLGNIEANPRAGLLFVDWSKGDVLHLACYAEIVWEDAARRRLRLAVREGRWRAAASPLRWATVAP
jgi:predicted pyridoxine 5'-phosphate oxidase superfamily flavin-nucleotide-binding protein